MDMHRLFDVPRRSQSPLEKMQVHLDAFHGHHRIIGELLRQMCEEMTIALLKEAQDHWRAAGFHLAAAEAAVMPKSSFN
jgi:hypothetical protein